MLSLGMLWPLVYSVLCWLISWPRGPQVSVWTIDSVGMFPGADGGGRTMLTFCRVCMRRAWNDSSWCWRACNTGNKGTEHLGEVSLCWNCGDFVWISPKMPFSRRDPRKASDALSPPCLLTLPWRFLWRTHGHWGIIYLWKQSAFDKHVWRKQNVLTFSADCGWTWLSDSATQPYSKKRNGTTVWFLF